MNKSEVCVKLTRKNCKKVWGILEIFWEKVNESTKRYLEQEGDSHFSNPCIEFWDSEWVGSVNDENKTVIKPRKLRNILAKEHLKKGDVIVARINTGIAKVDYVTSFNYFYETGLSGTNWVCLDDNTPEITTGEGSFDNFIRFATEEEKALLDPKVEFGVEEFQVGEWYTTKNGEVVNYQKDGNGYGVDISGTWRDTGWLFHNKQNWRKATEAEVIEALKKECVKRYGEDWENVKIKDNVVGGGAVNTRGFAIFVNTDSVWNRNGRLFCNGKWAEPLKEPVTYTREVWVNHYSDQEFHVHKKKSTADHLAHLNGNLGRHVKTVTATLTYDIPMTKV